MTDLKELKDEIFEAMGSLRRDVEVAEEIYEKNKSEGNKHYVDLFTKQRSAAVACWHLINDAIPDCEHCDDTGWINDLERCICVRK